MSETNQQTLGKYRIVKEIGRGGFSVVYHAVDTSLKDRPVALKVLHPQLLIDPVFIQRFHQEAGVAANLKHPHIATIHEVSEIEGSHFIAMEFVDGASLDAIISHEGPLPLERVVKIVTQIASALDYAHSEGLIHRDVKSGNIIVGPGDHAVLTDFGLVKASEGTMLTSMGQTLGTPEYMSPEQAEGKEVDWRSDLYSLGVVVYEMCTGQVPFKGPTPSSVHYQHVNKEPPRPSELNPDLAGRLEEILLKGLEKRPEDRFQKAQELVEELADAARELEESKLASLYAEAEELFETGDFQRAASKFEELLKRRPQYRDAAALLEECRRQEQIPIWANEARNLVEQARERLGMIRQVDPDYEDPEGVLAILTDPQRALASARKQPGSMTAQIEAVAKQAQQALIQKRWAEERERRKAEAEAQARGAEKQMAAPAHPEQRSGRAVAALTAVFIVIVVIVALLSQTQQSQGPQTPMWPTETIGGTCLGISSDTVTKELQSNRQLPVDRGMYITAVFGEPATKAGIQVYDIIVNINGQEISNSDQLSTAIARAGIGNTIRIGLYRGQQVLQIEAKVGQRTLPQGCELPLDGK